MSSVFFKFKSQKDPQRVTFDGTGISVFELKREIINISKLGDGTDFDLVIYNQDTNEEYDDDTTIIPRSTSVIARRLPASKPGQGRAARYVSGRMPVLAKNNYRKEQSGTPASKPGSSATNGISAMDNAKTEEERMKAIFEMGGAQWEQQQQHMSNATRVSMPGFKNKNVPIPDHDPPVGYVCYRCGQKGHWIQACPTNDNPEFEGKPRIKRITGIPRSFLKTVEEPAAPQQDGLTDETRQPASIMVNAEGERVVAVPDMASWQKYQEKAQASAATKDAAARGSKELQDRGLQCPIDKRLFVDPMKTPCCGTTYCNECIENALINSDLVCPNCSTDGVLLDNLTPDNDVIEKIKAYEEEKKAEKKVAEQPASPKPVDDAEKAQDDTEVAASKSPTSKSTGKRKRSVDEDEGAEHKSDDTAAEAVPNVNETSEEQVKPLPLPETQEDFINQMNAMAGLQNGGSAMPNGMPMMSMPPMMGMPPPMMMMNPMMMMGNQWGNMGGMMPGMPFNNMNQGWQQNMNMNGGWNNNAMFGSQQYQGSFYNQQSGQNDNDAYIRKPVNPHRHQGRAKRIRPTDYREV